LRNSEGQWAPNARVSENAKARRSSEEVEPKSYLMTRRSGSPSGTPNPFDGLGPSTLKGRSVRGGVAALLAQGLMFVLQMGSTIVLARLLSPEDFGLQGMVVSLTGFLFLFRDAGLGFASVQREDLTHEQTSALFWINVFVGIMLTLATVMMAPLIAGFYKEPRLVAVTIVSASAFLVNSLGVQHRALLSRALRLVTVAKIDSLALAVSTVIGVGMAALGYGYWALVGSAVSHPFVVTLASWAAMPWLPGRPARGSDVRAMLHIGGTVTLNSLVVYLAYNTEKILLGRFWGAEVLGLYGRAYQLANLPVNQLNSAISGVAYPALSRAQSDAERFPRSFLKGYSVVISLTIPAVIGSAVFAEECVLVLLGAKWGEAARVLRLLAPAMFAFSLISPFGWFLQASGRVGRSLAMAFVIAPVVILGIVAGLGWGPNGVASGYSVAMSLLVAPLVLWAIRGTGITVGRYWESVSRPLTAGAMAGAAGWGVKALFVGEFPPFAVLIVGMTVLLAVYLWALLIVMGQKALYQELLSHRSRRRPMTA
jgi:O-antigen/teichoic acid export membrane protein